MTVCQPSCAYVNPFTSFPSPYSLTRLHPYHLESFSPLSARVHQCTLQNLLRCSYLPTLAPPERPQNRPIFSSRRHCHREQIHHLKMLVYSGHLANADKSTSAGATFRTIGNGYTPQLSFPCNIRECKRLLPRRIPSSTSEFGALACKLLGYWRSSRRSLAQFPRSRPRLVESIQYTTHPPTPPLMNDECYQTDISADDIGNFSSVSQFLHMYLVEKVPTLMAPQQVNM
jgi:hypothetical protein